MFCSYDYYNFLAIFYYEVNFKQATSFWSRAFLQPLPPLHSLPFIGQVSQLKVSLSLLSLKRDKGRLYTTCILLGAFPKVLASRSGGIMQFFRKNASQIHSSWRARAVNNPCMSWCSTTASAVVLHSNFPLAAAGWKLPHFLGKKGKSTGKSYYHLRGISLCNCIHGQWFHSSFLMAERDHSMTLWVVAMPSLWWCSK